MAEEIIRFRHSISLPGVTILDAVHTERPWHVVNSAYGLAAPRDWIGDLRYRGRQQTFEAGDVFLTEPGEVHSTTRIIRPGAFSVLVLDESALARYTAEAAPHLRQWAWRRSGVKMSQLLAQRLDAVFRIVGTDAAPLLVQATVDDLIAAALDELVDDPRSGRRMMRHRGPIARVRDYLHDDIEGWVDLATLAAHAGLSRFHMLREFKRHYGMPPHAFQAGLKVAKAQQLLRARVPPAQVAAACGFADQSHFTRYFKQALGVTPGAFIRDLR